MKKSKRQEYIQILMERMTDENLVTTETDILLLKSMTTDELRRMVVREDELIDEEY